MTTQHIRTWLDNRPFQPFRVKMDDSNTFDVRHPEFATIDGSGALLIFLPGEREFSDSAGLPVALDIRNISSVEPVSIEKRPVGKTDGN